MAAGRVTGFPVLFLVLLALVLTAGSLVECAQLVTPPAEKPVIRIAVFQMAPDPGNLTANHATIEHAIDLAAARGADWFITPEMAESGYEFADYLQPDQLPVFPSPWFVSLRQRARDHRISLFIGFPENDNGSYYNAVAVIDRNGQIAGVRHKIDIIPGKYEGWARPGTPAPLVVDGHRIGYYICADAVNTSLTERYVADNVEILLSSAAWYPDPAMGPDACWENVSRVSGVPLVIANTAGKTGTIDFTRAESRVYLKGEKIFSVPAGEPAIAFFDWNYRTGEVTAAGEPVSSTESPSLPGQLVLPVGIPFPGPGPSTGASGKNAAMLSIPV